MITSLGYYINRGRRHYPLLCLKTKVKRSALLRSGPVSVSCPYLNKLNKLGLSGDLIQHSTYHKFPVGFRQELLT